MGKIRLFKVKNKKRDYDRENLLPILRCSICTGEQVAGFKDKRNGKFVEIMLIRDKKDLDEFMETYDLTEIDREY